MTGEAHSSICRAKGKNVARGPLSKYLKVIKQTKKPLNKVGFICPS